MIALPAGRANLIACLLNILNVLKTSWSVSQTLTTKVFTPRQANGFLLWVFRFATEKNCNRFFHNGNSLMDIDYCEVAEIAV